MEHGWDQAEAVRGLLQAAGFEDVASRRDLAGIERISGGRWPEPALAGLAARPGRVEHAHAAVGDRPREGRAVGGLSRDEVVGGAMHAGVDQQGHDPGLVGRPGAGGHAALDDVLQLLKNRVLVLVGTIVVVMVGVDDVCVRKVST